MTPRSAHPVSPLVVKLGGTTIASERGVLRECVGIARDRPVVVVHGGGKRLTSWLDRLGVEHRFQEGLRVTDDATFEVCCAVLSGVVNTELVQALRLEGGDAVGLSGADGGLISGRRVEHLGRVIRPTAVRREMLDLLLKGGLMPVVAPIGVDPKGVPCNMNADDAAAAIAGDLAGALVLLTDSDGVRDATGVRLDLLPANAAERLIGTGVISGGMIPKVRAALHAASETRADVVIADGRVPHALALALGRPGSGTRITP